MNPVKGQGRHSQAAIQKSGAAPKTHEIFGIANCHAVCCCLLLSYFFSARFPDFDNFEGLKKQILSTNYINSDSGDLAEIY